MTNSSVLADHLSTFSSQRAERWSAHTEELVTAQHREGKQVLRRRSLNGQYYGCSQNIMIDDKGGGRESRKGQKSMTYYLNDPLFVFLLVANKKRCFIILNLKGINEM